MSEESTTSVADFEKALNELEDLVRKLEQGELSLEQSLSAFERGVKLTRECQSALRNAEQRVQQLMQRENGDIETRPFNPEADQE
jgi:exodeoxyribonuclease VII small subunit